MTPRINLRERLIDPNSPERRPRRAAYALPTFFTAGNLFLGFLAILDLKPSDWVGVGLVILATLGLATLSWRFVEQPFRHGLASRRPGRLALWAGGLTIAVFSIGGHVTEGYPSRVSAEVRAMLA